MNRALSSLSAELLIPGFPGVTFGELIIFIILLIIGIVIIMVLAAVIHFIIPIIAAVAVWFLTHSLLYAGVAFVVVAIIQLIVRRGR